MCLSLHLSPHPISTYSESGSKLRSKRRSRRSKKSSSSLSSSPSNQEITSHSLSSEVAEGQSLVHIPEEDTLPFPDAGLPATEPPNKTGDNVEDSTPTLQRGSSFVSKMKELAKQVETTKEAKQVYSIACTCLPGGTEHGP